MFTIFIILVTYIEKPHKNLYNIIYTERGNVNKTLKIVLISVVFLVVLIVAAIAFTKKDVEVYNPSVSTTESTTQSTTESTTETTTNTTTETTTKASTNSFYQYAKYRAPNAKPADESKHGRILILVNNYNELAEDFQWNLVYWSNGQAVDKSILNKSDFDIQAIDKMAYEPLKAMFKAAEEAGVPLDFYSGYRSIVRQNRNFVRSVENNMKSGLSLEEAKAKTNKSRAYPGTSEHNVGLAIDLLAKGSSDLSNNFEKTPQFKWLMENAENYGFVLRYPKDKTDITEIIYEPWHYRYVGVEHAKKMNQLGMCLEEYIEYLES